MDIKTWEAYCEANVTAGYTPGGKARNIPASGLAIVDFLQAQGVLHNDVSILDVGCGNGRLAIGLDLSTLTRYTYHGLEIIKPVVEFCQGAFHNKPHSHFTHLDVYNAHYWPDGKQKAENVTFPVGSGSVDVVTAFSLFTHLESKAQALNYLSEMMRVLKPGGVLFSTWSFTTLRDQVAMNAGHTVWLFKHVLDLMPPTGRYEFLSLDNERFPDWYNLTGAPNQAAIVITK